MKDFPRIIPIFPLSGVIYFPKTKLETTEDSVDSVAANEPTVEVGTDAMAAYTAAISKNVKSVKI